MNIKFWLKRVGWWFYCFGYGCVWVGKQYIRLWIEIYRVYEDWEVMANARRRIERLGNKRK